MNEQQTKEWIILIALFKATVEQSTMLKGTLSRETKMIFNRWFKEGCRILDKVEENSWEKHLEEVTEIIELPVNELRKTLKLQ
jgi:hypothetical protein